MRYYITPEDYEKAKRIGVNENLLYTRVYFHNWSIDRAVSTPVKKQPNLKDHLYVARKNGIKDTTFYMRVSRGMPPEQASTKPTKDINKSWLDKQRKKSLKKTRKYPDWVYDNLEKNNINRVTFFKRINEYGWTLEDACTTPTMRQGQKRKITRNHIWRKHDEARYQEYVSRRKNKV